MLSRIILVLLVLAIVAVVYLFGEQIKSIIGAFLVGGFFCGLGGIFFNWIACGDLLCWSAFVTGAYIGFGIVAAIVVIRFILWLVRLIF